MLYCSNWFCECKGGGRGKKCVCCVLCVWLCRCVAVPDTAPGPVLIIYCTFSGAWSVCVCVCGIANGMSYLCAERDLASCWGWSHHVSLMHKQTCSQRAAKQESGFSEKKRKKSLPRHCSFADSPNSYYLHTPAKGEVSVCLCAKRKASLRGYTPPPPTFLPSLCRTWEQILHFNFAASDGERACQPS